MKEHPGHFWICFWILLVGMSIGLNLVDIKGAIEANTAAIIGVKK